MDFNRSFYFWKFMIMCYSLATCNAFFFQFCVIFAFYFCRKTVDAAFSRSLQCFFGEQTNIFTALLSIFTKFLIKNFAFFCFVKHISIIHLKICIYIFLLSSTFRIEGIWFIYQTISFFYKQVNNKHLTKNMF